MAVGADAAAAGGAAAGCGAALGATSAAGTGFAGSAAKFLGIFAVTQVPLAISEGLLTVLVLNLLRSHAGDEVGHLVPALKGAAK